MISSSTLRSGLIEETYDGFRKEYGYPAEGVVLAPGRVNLIGEHTDYNDGFVLPMAVDRYVALAFSARADRRVRIWTNFNNRRASFDADSPMPDEMWVRYTWGAFESARAEDWGPGGLDLAVCSSLPVGAGLSSSAAFEVAIVLACAHTVDESPACEQLARVAHRGESKYVGVPSGIMDQFASACCRPAHALLLDCRDLGTRHVPLEDDIAVVVIDTQKVRHLAGGEYDARVAACRQAVRALSESARQVRSLREVTLPDLERSRDHLHEDVFRMARHVVTENKRPVQMAQALLARDWEHAGRLMHDSHRSLADDYNVSCDELDHAVDLAASYPGCFGARLTGAGFGGCAIALVERASAEGAVAYLNQHYPARFGKGHAYRVEATAGAHVITV